MAPEDSKGAWDEIQQFTPLRTKLHVPPLRAGWISRPRLDKRMDEGFARKLTLISAPAGFGKTTLSVDWAHTHKIPVAWFSVDSGDNDPLYFLTCHSGASDPGGRHRQIRFGDAAITATTTF